MPQFSESIDIERPPEDVWRAIGTPERWLEGYLETRSRSADYPGPDTRDDHLYRTRREEAVDARVNPLGGADRARGGPGREDLLPARPLQPEPVPHGDHLAVQDDVSFKGLGKLAAPIASRDIKKRWETSLERLKAAAEGGQ